MNRIAAVLSAALLLGAVPTLASEKISREQVTVKGQNDEWTETGITVAEGDVILIEATGKVLVGSWTGEVEANGESELNPSKADINGRLVFKIGTEGARAAGQRAFVVSKDAGPLKLKVHDKKYTDNKGAFEVSVIKIPSALIPKPAVAADSK